MKAFCLITLPIVSILRDLDIYGLLMTAFTGWVK